MEIKTEKTNLGLRWLDDMYERMREEYALAEDKEEGARKAMAVYEENLSLIEQLSGALAKVSDFYNTLLEAVQQLERARAKGDHGAHTIKGHGCMVVKLVPCGKQCNGCPHGPYAYEVRRVGGKLVWKYLGRADP